MKQIILLITMSILMGCSAKPVNELDAMTKDVIQSKTGVEISVKPLEEVKS